MNDCMLKLNSVSFGRIALIFGTTPIRTVKTRILGMYSVHRISGGRKEGCTGSFHSGPLGSIVTIGIPSISSAGLKGRYTCRLRPVIRNDDQAVFAGYGTYSVALVGRCASFIACNQQVGPFIFVQDMPFCPADSLHIFERKEALRPFRVVLVPQGRIDARSYGEYSFRCGCSYCARCRKQQGTKSKDFTISFL